jgi:hypothetical protein
MIGTDEVAASIRALRSGADGVPSSARSARSRRVSGVVAALAAVLGPGLIWVGGAALAAASVTDVRSDAGSDDGCVGFHCMTPRQGVAFAAVYLGVFVVPVATIISVAAASLVGPERRAAVVTWVLIAYAAAMALVVALVVGQMPPSDRIGG